MSDQDFAGRWPSSPARQAAWAERPRWRSPQPGPRSPWPTSPRRAATRPCGSIEDAGGEAHFLATDVADARSVEDLVRATVEAFGGLDCAVNGAAIELERERFADIEVETFDQIIAVNLRSIFLCLKYELRQMLAAGPSGERSSTSPRRTPSGRSLTSRRTPRASTACSA